MTRVLFICVAVLSCTALFGQSPKQLSEAERNYILVETLNRIGGDLNSNPALKEAVYNTLPKLRGTEAFVHIVKKFALKDQDSDLLQIAFAHPNDQLGVEAAQIILNNGHAQLFSDVLSRTNSEANKAIGLLGNVKETRIVPLLFCVITNDTRDAAFRKSAIRAVVQTQQGATQLLALAKTGKLAESLKFYAGSELHSVRWTAIQHEAETILPSPQGKNTEAFPPIATLAQMKGDAANGQKIFQRETSMCSRCHEVAGKGGQIGPALTEIGTKLGREALIEAILDPSAGISFGFEAFNITLKTGDEAYGLIASETEDEIAVKDINGIVSRYKKSDIAKRDQLKTSIMPVGLQQTMTTQEFVDLIEYLSSLKKIEQVKR